MSDAIGELGLDVKPFEEALSIANKQLVDLRIESNKLNAEIKLLEKNMFLAGGGTKAQAAELRKLTTVAEDFKVQIKHAKDEQSAFAKAALDPAKIGVMEKALKGAAAAGYNFSRAIGNIGKQLLTGFGIGTVVSVVNKLQEASVSAKKLNDEINAIGQDNSSPEFRTLDYLEDRIDKISVKLKELQSVPTSIEAGASVLSQWFEDMTEGKFHTFGGTAEDIAKRKDAQRDMLVAEKEKAEISKKAKEADAEWMRKEEANNDRAWKKREEAIKSIEEQKKAVTEQAAVEAKQAMDALLGDMDSQFKIQEKIDDKEAARLDKVREIAKENEKITEQLKLQNSISGFNDSGNPTAANDVSIRGKYAERIKEANRTGNDAAVAEIERQQARELQGNLVDEGRMTGKDRRELDRAQSREARDANRAQARRDELNRRGKAGAQSEDIRDEGRRRDIADGIVADVEKNKADNQRDGIWTSKDAENLQKIREALTAKD